VFGVSDHPLGHPFAAGVALEDQQSIQQPVDVEVLVSTDRWGPYTRAKARERTRMWVAPGEIITAFDKLARDKTIPSYARPPIEEWLKLE
jgi:hypothetical protein